ncbi:MAG: hypothetical protein WCS42_17705 [Verrucomicrobiota bacterium]
MKPTLFLAFPVVENHLADTGIKLDSRNTAPAIAQLIDAFPIPPLRRRQSRAALLPAASAISL